MDVKYYTERILQLFLRLSFTMSFVVVLIVKSLFYHSDNSMYSDDFNIWLTNYTVELVDTAIILTAITIILKLIQKLISKY
tara:strand:- start:27999 stop:28241 length:243 start_codon:yes stop_codon:yes gene_type:complete